MSPKANMLDRLINAQIAATPKLGYNSKDSSKDTQSPEPNEGQILQVNFDV